MLRQRGFNLIELMIAMAIGMVLVAGAFTVFSANTTTFRLQRTSTDAQEAGRFALDFLAKDIRRAGAGYEQADVVEAENNTITDVAGLLSDSDGITIRYMAAVATTDCEGNAAAQGDRIVNRYFVKADNELAGLFCDGKVIAAAGAETDGIVGGVSLIRGVESFQVLYGLSTRSEDVLVNGYGQPEQYSNTIASGKRVVSVRLGLLVRSEQGVKGLPGVSGAFPVLDSEIAAATVNAVEVNGQPVVHRLFTTTVALRNLVNVVPGV